MVTTAVASALSQVLAVVYRPDPEAGESNTDYLVRMQSERVLTLHASFNPDE